MADGSAPIAKPKKPVGRPSDYDPTYCERVIGYGRKGYSRAEIASALDCARHTMARWESEWPDFHAAMVRAKDEELAWFEAKGRAGLESKDFNAQMFRLNMLGRFPDEPYREKIEFSGTVKHEHTVKLETLADTALEQLAAACELLIGPGISLITDQSGTGASEDSDGG